MLTRFSYILGLIFVASIAMTSCKTTPSDPGNTITHIDIGDSIPNKFSVYSYNKWQLDAAGVVNSTTFQNYGSTQVDSIGLTFQGKSNVYLLRDQNPDAGSFGDSAYFAYESNSDVSLYLQNPGFLKNAAHGNQPDEILAAIANIVFHTWIRLPIASKDTALIEYNASQSIDVGGTTRSAAILARVDYIGDSTITVGVVPLLSKHCRISISAKIFLGSDVTLTHVRDIWFVPKIGNIAMETAKTFMPENTILSIPLDTTSTLKLLKSYNLK